MNEKQKNRRQRRLEDNSVDYDSESGHESKYNETLCDDLAAWINKYQIKHNAVDDLLKILKKYGHLDIPSTARILLKHVKSKRNIVTELNLE
ncbi:Hypothetical predicted protein [Mytilus galloprovincialis]|uniref:Uncharacterized protein n=1 Tax=Mytilus galloprovincialis TaxID=29158 RepID=A0A8B6H9F9_MYTGA|nr:Hypothetical predicted protein [Mytilus galloprovincialis]